MKVKTIERFFLIIFVPFVLIGIHLWLAGAYRSTYFEEHPFSGSLRGEWHFFMRYAIGIGITIILGLILFRVLGIKLKLEADSTKIKITPKITITPKKKAP